MNVFRSLLTGLLAVMFLTAVAVAGMTHDAPEGNYNGHMGTLKPMTGKPHNVPEFVPTPGCTPEVELADVLLVVDYDNDVIRMPYDEVERRQASKSWADNVWVIGSC